MSANSQPRERELVKLAELAAAMADALRDRGVSDPAASLAAETGIAIYKVAFARWISEAAQPDLPGFLQESLEELRSVLVSSLPLEQGEASGSRTGRAESVLIPRGCAGR